MNKVSKEKLWEMYQTKQTPELREQGMVLPVRQ